MGLTRRLFRVTTQEPEWLNDWAEAELVERVDVIEAQVETLDAERERLETNHAGRVELIETQVEMLDAERIRLETELAKSVALIETQVEILDSERDRLETDLVERVKAIEAQVELLDAERNQLETKLSVGQSRPARIVRLRQHEEVEPPASVKATPINWGRLALLAAFLLAPWVLIGALLFIAWLLLTW